jgi:hypothetical protein
VTIDRQGDTPGDGVEIGMVSEVMPFKYGADGTHRRLGIGMSALPG